MKKTIGILAHVDAGKTSFSEQLLFRTGAIRSLGRVDHGNAFLDDDPIERRRGITIFSDQARFELAGDEYYWIDTPGHADFIAETERALPVLDYAILIVSAAEGVESHTETIWRLLEKHRIPTIVFLNKLDRIGSDAARCIEELRTQLSAELVDFRGFDGCGFSPDQIEAAAERDEKLLNRLMSDQYDFDAWKETLVCEIQDRRLFPLFGGCALTGDGIDDFLRALPVLTRTAYAEQAALPFGARVYKLRHDAQGQCLAHLKLLSGTLRVRDEIEAGGALQKVTELRAWHGGKSRVVKQAVAGEIVSVSGIRGLRPGDGLGALQNSALREVIEPMQAVSVHCAPAVSPSKLLETLRMLEAEDPALRVEVDSRSSEISLSVMGEIQPEVLLELLRERFDIDVSFGPARILYRETIEEPVIGIGHYEPLRHYAEVWLRLVPGPRGSGIRFSSRCHVDTLALNWQRLIESHVFERPLSGVLTGAELTDVSVELICGRAHLKHTEGGDFRESTHRAIRNALMQAKSRLLEPVCRFELNAPEESFGRVMGDLKRLRADAEPPVAAGGRLHVTGECPLRSFSGYPAEFRALTHGRGSMELRLARYAPVPEKVAAALIAEAAYNPMLDDTPDSVFCAHGAGYAVAWREVRAHAHCTEEALRVLNGR